MHISDILERHFIVKDNKYHFISVPSAKAEIEPLEIDKNHKKQVFSQRRYVDNSHLFQEHMRDCA